MTYAQLELKAEIDKLEERKRKARRQVIRSFVGMQSMENNAFDAPLARYVPWLGKAAYEKGSSAVHVYEHY